jgi:hypothetical protein
MLLSVITTAVDQSDFINYFTPADLVTGDA